MALLNRLRSLPTSEIKPIAATACTPGCVIKRAAGVEAGGYADISAAAARMGGLREEFYRPSPENMQVYDRLYAEYKTLYDYFGRGQNDVMKRLREEMLTDSR